MYKYFRNFVLYFKGFLLSQHYYINRHFQINSIKTRTFYFSIHTPKKKNKNKNL
jgi:hypothetical protein